MEQNSGNIKAFEKVMNYIKGKILSGELCLGEKLPPERALAIELDVSRNSVREALRTLEIMGVITSQQGAGNYVSSNFEKNLVESMAMMFVLENLDYPQLSELRSSIEIKALKLAVEKRTPEQLKEILEIIDEMQEATNENRNVILDKQLHYMIAKCSGNKLILDILQALSGVMDLFIADLRREILADFKSGKRLEEVHQRLGRCIELQDAEGAVEAMEEHFALIDKNVVHASEKRKRNSEKEA